MSKYPYQKLKNAELRKICAERGVDIDLNSAKRMDLVKALRQYDDENEQEIMERAEPSASTAKSPAKKKTAADSDHPMKGKVKILIPNSNGDQNSDRPLFVGCNGRSWFIPLEKPVIVPKEVKNVLQLAVKSVSHKDDHGRLVHRTAQRIPYQILEEGPD